MRKFKEYIDEANLPGGPMGDRSLEGFQTILNQLEMQMKSVLNPQAKQELQNVVNHFRLQILQVLEKYKMMGVGYSPNYQAPNNPFGNIPSV